MAEALRAEYRLCEIPPVAGMAKSGASTPGTPGPKARPKSAPQRGGRSSRRSGPAAAHTATGASPPWQTPASGPFAASWGTRAWSPAPPGRGGATARARARSPRRPRTRCATRGGQATLRGRQAQRAADRRPDRVPHPRRQGVPLAHRGLLRRHAAELVDIDLARCRDGELIPDRRVRAARRRGPPHGAPG